MEAIFYGAAAFSNNVAGWDVSACESMKMMFKSAAAFSGGVAGWDVSACKDMERMFYGAAAFSDDFAGWDVSACENMEGIFCGAAVCSGDVAGWDKSACTSMENMFRVHNARRSFSEGVPLWRDLAVGSPGSTRGGAGAIRKGRPAGLVLLDTAARSADRDGTQSHGPSNTAEWTPKTRFKNTKSYSPRPSGVGGMDSPGMLVRRKQADKMGDPAAGASAVSVSSARAPLPPPPAAGSSHGATPPAVPLPGPPPLSSSLPPSHPSVAGSTLRL